MSSSLIVDLEATCFEGCELGDMEIIEIGACRVDQIGRIEDSFSSFVKPSRSSITAYCTEITNITVRDVAAAPSLALAFNKMHDWLQMSGSHPTNWYSWGAFDRRLIEQECSEKNITHPLPSHLCAKKLFQKRQLPKGKRVGLNKALVLKGLQFEGIPHRALDDALNVARLFTYFANETSRTGIDNKE